MAIKSRDCAETYIGTPHKSSRMDVIKKLRILEVVNKAEMFPSRPVLKFITQLFLALFSRIP